MCTTPHCAGGGNQGPQSEDTHPRSYRRNLRAIPEPRAPPPLGASVLPGSHYSPPCAPVCLPSSRLLHTVFRSPTHSLLLSFLLNLPLPHRPALHTQSHTYACMCPRSHSHTVTYTYSHSHTHFLTPPSSRLPPSMPTVPPKLGTGILSEAGREQGQDGGWAGAESGGEKSEVLPHPGP